MSDKFNNDKNNFFLDTEQIQELANTLKKSFGNSLKEVMDSINKTDASNDSLIPVKNSKLVEQKPHLLRKAKSKMSSNNVYSIICGIVTLGSVIEFIDTFTVLGNFSLSTLIVGIVAAFGTFFFRKKAVSLKTDVQIMERYNKYLRGFGRGTVCNIKELAIFTGVDEDTVKNDLTYYINKDFLKEARIVNGAVILDNQSYLEYKKLNIETETEHNSEKNYLNELFNYYNSIDEPVKSDVKELLLIVEKIYKNAKDTNEIEHFEKFQAYYLPSALKLLSEYDNIQKLGVNSQKVTELKSDIENSIKIINEAFRNLLNDLYEDNVIDIKTDITVLKSMLYQDGLLDRM